MVAWTTGEVGVAADIVVPSYTKPRESSSTHCEVNARNAALATIMMLPVPLVLLQVLLSVEGSEGQDVEEELQGEHCDSHTPHLGFSDQHFFPSFDTGLFPFGKYPLPR